MHSVFLLPEGYSDTNICQQAAAQGLAIKPLSGFYSEVDQPVTQGLVIGFAGFTPEEMARGIEVLKAVILNQTPS
jgi:GntR family transcriptional regulator/MocR family aminotransferase